MPLGFQADMGFSQGEFIGTDVNITKPHSALSDLTCIPVRSDRPIFLNRSTTTMCTLTRIKCSG
jgi:hypothetical protein